MPLMIGSSALPVKLTLGQTLDALGVVSEATGTDVVSAVVVLEVYDGTAEVARSIGMSWPDALGLLMAGTIIVQQEYMDGDTG